MRAWPHFSRDDALRPRAGEKRKTGNALVFGKIRSRELLARGYVRPDARPAYLSVAGGRAFAVADVGARCAGAGADRFSDSRRGDVERCEVRPQWARV